MLPSGSDFVLQIGSQVFQCFGSQFAAGSCVISFSLHLIFFPGIRKGNSFSGVPRTKTKGYKPRRLSTKRGSGFRKPCLFLLFLSFSSSASFLTLYLPRLTEVIGSGTQGRESSIRTKTPKKNNKKKRITNHNGIYIYSSYGENVVNNKELIARTLRTTRLSTIHAIE